MSQEIITSADGTRIACWRSGEGPPLVLVHGTAADHGRWNAGDEEARVRVEIRPGARFEGMALNLFGLAQDGRTNPKGMPNPLQAAIFAREFGDVLHFTKPRFSYSDCCSAPWGRSPGLWAIGAATQSTPMPRSRIYRAPKGLARRPRRGYWRGHSLWRHRSY